jgi:alanine dehydrogenase
MVTEGMVRSMKRGSVLVDVTCGYGMGYMPTFDSLTDFDAPVYEKFGVLHCKIDRLPSAVPLSGVAAVSHAYLPYLIRMAKSELRTGPVDRTSQRGMIVRNFQLVHAELRRHARMLGWTDLI